MFDFLNKKYIPFFALFFVVFISRLPFLAAGYGVEEDSWGIALAVFHTKITGIYEPSRFPGHPVQEFIYLALCGYGPFVFNLLSAFFSATAALFFALILKHLNFKHYFIAAFAFAFTPVFYISSTYTIDFVWSEAFVLISLYLLLKNKLFLTGVFLGLAIGCRITCGAMLIPFMMILWQRNDVKQNFAAFLKIAVPMAVIAVTAFVPLIWQFGTSFFMYYDQFPYPPAAKVLYKMTLGVFGFAGILAMAAALIAVFVNKTKTKGMLFLQPLDKKIVAASFTIIVLYLISYFRLPQKSGYMIPIIPFIILLFGYYLNGRSFKLLCCAFVLSSFICSFNLTDKLRGASYSKFAVIFSAAGQEIFFDPLSGPVFSDYSKRRQKMTYTDEVIKKAAALNSKTVIIAGWWYNEIMVTMIGRPVNGNVIYVPYIDESQIKKYAHSGYQITYLPEQNIYNDQMFKMKVTDKEASPF